MELSRTDQIRGYVTETFHQNGIEDTPENRLQFLEMIRNEWREAQVVDADEKWEKTFYEIALIGEIMIERFRCKYHLIVE